MVETALMSRETVEAEEDNSRGDAVVKRTSNCNEQEGRVEVCEELLPGIPNEITLDLIAPKLPWTTFHLLSSVSRCWQQAIQSRQVYHARVCTQSSQKLIVMSHSYCLDIVGEFTLLSLHDGHCYRLPPIPGCTSKPSPHQCICLDGKLYVMGGYKKSLDVLSAEVYMLDLVAQKQWRQCASMADPRADFGSGVINGKIYVFGGAPFQMKPAKNCASEVYDPESNSWSAIAPTKSPSSYPYEVITWGEEFLVHSELNRLIYADIYNPLDNQWRTADHSIQRGEIAFMAGGRLHKLSLNWKGEIDVHYICASSWKPVHTFSRGDIGPRDTLLFDLLQFAQQPQLVDDELLVGASWISCDVNRNCTDKGTCLLRIKGFGRCCQEIDLPWQTSALSMSFEITPRHLQFLCPIQPIRL